MLRKTGTLVVVALILGVAPAGLAAVTSLHASAKMDSQQVVVPRRPVGNVAHAKGTFVGTLSRTRAQWRLAWRITYEKLANPVVVIADIHRGKPGHFGPILVRLCANCHSGQTGVKAVTADTVRTMKRGGAFITLITGRNPNGEIRGQIRAGS
ncbi:MAG TPA: CHRD domain-containing protein [Gaiellaceae bacterium]|nr:CHRD domain-containing protein [Gaiellaceae bacterium]